MKAPRGMKFVRQAGGAYRLVPIEPQGEVMSKSGFNPVNALKPPPGSPRPVSWPNTPPSKPTQTGAPWKPVIGKPLGALRPVASKPKPAAVKPKPAAVKPKPRPAAKPSSGTRPAARPQRPKTFTDSHGVVHQLRPVGSKPKPAATKPGAAKPVVAKPVVAKPDTFIQDEIDRQIAQDLGATTFTDTQTEGIAKLMSEQAAQAAQIAAQYAPTTAYANPTLDANAQAAVAQDLALTNAVGSDQAGSLAGLIAKSGSASADLLNNMRAAGQTQHRDYARLLQGQKAGLEEQRRMQLEAEARARREEALNARLQNAQMSLAQKQFGLQVGQAAVDNQYRYDALDASTAPAPAKPVDKGVYGFGANRDEALAAVIGKWQASLEPTIAKDGTTVPPTAKRPWRELHASLVSFGGLNPDQAALLATKSRPEAIKNAKGGARGVLAMLKGRKVSPKVQAFIIKTHFGPKVWAALNNPVQTAAGNAINAVQGML